MELLQTFNGISGSHYRLNPFGGEKYTYTKWENDSDFSIQKWQGSATLEQAQADYDQSLKDTRERMGIITPEGEKIYLVSDIGETDEGKITEILKRAYEKYSRDDVKLIRNVL